MNVADYMEKVYPDKPCWPLIYDVLATERGLVSVVCKTVTGTVRDAVRAFAIELTKGEHGFRQIDAPVDFAVLLLGRTTTIGIHHAGIYYDGKVLHALSGEGGQIILHQDLSSLLEEYQLVQYWFKDADE